MIEALSNAVRIEYARITDGNSEIHVALSEFSGDKFPLKDARCIDKGAKGEIRSDIDGGKLPSYLSKPRTSLVSLADIFHCIVPESGWR